MSRYSFFKPLVSDFEFLRNVHHLTLKEYVSVIWGWEESAQDAFFKSDFEEGQIQVIRAFGESVGYVQLNLEEDALHIINILILPEFQNRGLGAEIIKDLISKSKEENRALKLGVFKINLRAKKLYESLGFELCGETETHYMMQIQP